MRDYYAMLQVDPDADAGVIAAAYRHLARKHHPDVARDPYAATRMRELNEAYEVLSDPERRGRYDWSRRAAALPAAPWRAAVDPPHPVALSVPPRTGLRGVALLALGLLWVAGFAGTGTWAVKTWAEQPTSGLAPPPSSVQRSLGTDGQPLPSGRYAPVRRGLSVAAPATPAARIAPVYPTPARLLAPSTPADEAPRTISDLVP